MHFQIRKQAIPRSQLYEKLRYRPTAHFAPNSKLYTKQTTKHACDAKNTDKMRRQLGRAARATKEPQRTPSEQVKQKELEALHVFTSPSTLHPFFASANAQICRSYRQKYAVNGKNRSDPYLYMRFWRSGLNKLASFPYLRIHQKFRIFASALFRLNRHFFRFSLHFQ